MNCLLFKTKRTTSGRLSTMHCFSVSRGLFSSVRDVSCWADVQWALMKRTPESKQTWVYYKRGSAEILCCFICHDWDIVLPYSDKEAQNFLFNSYPLSSALSGSTFPACYVYFHFYMFCVVFGASILINSTKSKLTVVCLKPSGWIDAEQGCPSGSLFR